MSALKRIKCAFAVGGESLFVDMEKKTRSEDQAVKNEFSAEQLLSYYQQGLDLHDQLMQLYQKKQMD